MNNPYETDYEMSDAAANALTHYQAARAILRDAQERLRLLGDGRVTLPRAETPSDLADILGDYIYDDKWLEERAVESDEGAVSRQREDAADARREEARL